jgi:hypothetical protein
MSHGDEEEQPHTEAPDKAAQTEVGECSNESSVGAAAADAALTTLAAGRKVGQAGALAASVAAKKVGQTGKSVATVGARKVAQAGKAAAKAGAAKAGQFAGAGRRLAVSTAAKVERGAKSAQNRLGGADGRVEAQKELPLHDLSEGVKLAYLKVLIWLTYQDDGQIDEREVAELQVLMVQLACKAESRQTLHSLIGDPRDLDAESHIAELGGQLQNSVQEKAVRHSLLKDATRLRLATSTEDSVSADNDLVRLAKLLGINKQQREFLLKACLADGRLLNENLSVSQVKTIAKDLSSKAAGVGVPIAAVYLSGSVTGLSAAGMTSGLAALGLGGLLGLSAMVTGVGAVVVGGVVIYQGSSWLMNRGQSARRQRREVMLHEALRIHQKAIANLAEDVGNLGERLTKLLTQTEVNRLRIEKLSEKLTLFGRAIGALREDESNLEEQLAAEARKNADNQDESDDNGQNPKGS